jgi:hypothetical protein
VGPAAVDAWDQEKENCRLNAWTIYRACRNDDNASADKLACDAANARAPVALLGTDPALVHAWQLARNAAEDAWYQRFKRVSGVAAALEHVHGDTSSYYFHARAKPRPPPVTLLTLNRPGRHPDASPDTADLATLTGVQEAMRYATGHFSSSSPSSLFSDRCPPLRPAGPSLAAPPGFVAPPAATLARCAGGGAGPQRAAGP